MIFQDGQKKIEYVAPTINLDEFTISKKIDGLNATVTISNKSFENGMISYKLINETNPELEYWHQTNGNTIKINKSGKYKIKFSDNSGNESTEKEINIMLINKPQIEENMDKVVYNSNTNLFEVVTDEQYIYDYSSDGEQINWAYEESSTGINYLWIPRFCYNQDQTEIKFLKGTTKIATDNTTIDETWTIPAIFSTDGEKTGIWSEVLPSEIAEIDLITLTTNQEENYPKLVDTLIASGEYKGAYVNYVDENGNPYKDINGTDILWRVLIIDTDSNRDQFVKLVTAGIPFNIYHGATTSKTVSVLTNTTAANFNTTLASYKNSILCDKVISILSSDIFKYYGVTSMNLNTTLTLDNILTINSAFLTGTSVDAYYMNYVNASNVYKKGTDLNIGVRPTVYLKSNVLFTGGDGTINNPYTIKWEEEEPETEAPEGQYPTLVNTLTAMGNYKGAYVKYVDENGYRYKDTYNHRMSWRALIIDTDSNQNQFVKLISAGIPFNAYHGSSSFTTVSILTNTAATNFNTNLASYKNSQICDKVISILSSDIFKYYGVASINLETTLTLDNILTINLAFLTGTANESYYMNYINASNIYKKGLDITMGVRPVAYLKSNVVVTGGDGTKNNPFTIKAGE